MFANDYEMLLNSLCQAFVQTELHNVIIIFIV